MKFIVDNNVGKLAVWLRALGYDAAFINPIEDDDLLAIARREGRIVLTRDTGIMRRRVVTSGEIVALAIEGDAWQSQLAQVVRHFGLRTEAIFTRCIEDNTPLQATSREQARAHVPPYVYRTQETFLTCPTCGRYFWQGTHWSRMNAMLGDTLAVG